MQQPQSMRPMQVGPITARVVARTDIGRERELNEDNFLVVDLSTAERNPAQITELGLSGLALGVFDGMGGAAAGEVASQMAADTMGESLLKLACDLSSREFARALRTTIERTNEAIYSHGRSHAECKGMGTTCTLVGVRGTELFVGQVGDSRAYLFRSDQLFRITKDQSLLGHLIEIGQVVSEHSSNAPAANLILQALGSKKSVDVALSRLDVRRGDRLLLCSDGLCGLLSDDEMQKVLIAFSDADACAKRLVDLANEAGGSDNITVVLCDLGGKGLPFPRDSEVIAHRPYDPDSTGVFDARSVPAPAVNALPSMRDVPTDVFVLPTNSSSTRSAKWVALVLVALALALGPMLWIDREDKKQARKPTTTIQLQAKPTTRPAASTQPQPPVPPALEPVTPPSTIEPVAPSPAPTSDAADSLAPSPPRTARTPPRRPHGPQKAEPAPSPPPLETPSAPAAATADWRRNKGKPAEDPF